MSHIDDELLKNVVREACIEIEPRSDALGRFKHRLRIEEAARARQSRQQKKVLIGVAGAAVIVALALSSSVVESGTGTFFDDIKVRFQRGYAVIQLWLRPESNPETGGLPSDYGPGYLPSPQILNYDTLTEAQQVSPFPLLIPSHLPSGVELEKITVTKQQVFHDQLVFDTRVELRFVGNSGTLIITQEHKPGVTAHEAGGHSTKHWDVEVINIRGTRGYFLEAKLHKENKLSWYEEPWTVSFEAPLGREELLRIAEGLHELNP